MRAFSTSTVLWIRLFYAVCITPATLFLIFRPLPRRIGDASQRDFDVFYILVFAASRILLFCSIFFIFHVAPRGDVTGFYFPEARSALHGQLVYRDFISSYAPLFSYISAGVVFLRNTPLALIAFTILLEVASLPVWFGALRHTGTEQQLRYSALLYLVQPLTLWDVAVDGGNNTWIALAIAVALLCLARRRDAASGIAYASTLVAVKFLPLIYAPVLFLGARRRLAWVAGFLVLPLAIFGGFAAVHANILQPLQQEGNLRLGGSLPLLFTYLTGIDLPGRLVDAITIVGLLGCLYLCAPIRKIAGPKRVWGTGMGILLLTLAMLMLSKKSWTLYIVMAMFLLCSLAARHGRMTRLLYCLFSFVAVVEPSFLFVSVGPLHLPMHALLMRGSGNAWLLMSMYILELVCAFWFGYLAVSEIRSCETSSYSPKQ